MVPAAATRAGRVLAWHERLFTHRPAPVLYVVGPEDWDKVALVPLYGLPHAEPDRVVIGTRPAAFWQHYLEVIAPRLPATAVGRLREVYGDPPDVGGRFGDLVLVHELAHLYHHFVQAAGETDFPRLWLAELFANVGLYGYVAEAEPEHLAHLMTVCEMSALAGADPWPVRELNRMHEGLADGLLNYIWFEHLLVLVAERIWKARGGPATSSCGKLFVTPISPTSRSSDGSAPSTRAWVPWCGRGLSCMPDRHLCPPEVSRPGWRHDQVLA